jgi:protein-tyrosine phosphatase
MQAQTLCGNTLAWATILPKNRDQELCMTVSVLFICTGNICRSPMAEAVFRQKVTQAGLQDQFRIDSAGTGRWHVGERPHRGTQEVLRQHGVPATTHLARCMDGADLRRYDYLVVMDRENEDRVRELARRGDQRGFLVRLMDFAAMIPADKANKVRDVPDPYYSNRFEEVYQLVDAGCDGLLRFLRQQHHLSGEG